MAAYHPNIHGMSGLSAPDFPQYGSTKPHGLPHAFGLNARLRAFSFGYRVMPIPNRNGQSPKSSKSAAPAVAVARRVGGLPVLKDNYFHDHAARH